MPPFPPGPGHRALRKGRASLPGQIYLITVVCLHRRPRFTDAAAAHAVCAVLDRVDSWSDAHHLAWVLMPDHWHALVQLGDVTPLPAVMRRVNSLAARAANAAAGERGQVWQSTYHDRALRAEENLRDCARYLIANPLRAGLVRSVRDYPYWNAIWL